MGVALTVYGGAQAKAEVAYLPVGANQIREHWLPIIESKGLQLLDVAVTGGLSVSPEYHPQSPGRSLASPSEMVVGISPLATTTR